jgi:hypothetical protein
MPLRPVDAFSHPYSQSVTYRTSGVFRKSPFFRDVLVDSLTGRCELVQGIQSHFLLQNSHIAVLCLLIRESRKLKMLDWVMDCF